VGENFCEVILELLKYSIVMQQSDNKAQGLEELIQYVFLIQLLSVDNCVRKGIFASMIPHRKLGQTEIKMHTIEFYYSVTASSRGGFSLNGQWLVGSEKKR
jgi:hypothetical protein